MYLSPDDWHCSTQFNKTTCSNYRVKPGQTYFSNTKNPQDEPKITFIEMRAFATLVLFVMVIRVGYYAVVFKKSCSKHYRIDYF